MILASLVNFIYYWWHFLHSFAMRKNLIEIFFYRSLLTQYWWWLSAIFNIRSWIMKNLLGVNKILYFIFPLNKIYELTLEPWCENRKIFSAHQDFFSEHSFSLFVCLLYDNNGKHEKWSVTSRMRKNFPAFHEYQKQFTSFPSFFKQLSRKNTRKFILQPFFNFHKNYFLVLISSRTAHSKNIILKFFIKFILAFELLSLLNFFLSMPSVICLIKHSCIFATQKFPL